MPRVRMYMLVLLNFQFVLSSVRVVRALYRNQL